MPMNFDIIPLIFEPKCLGFQKGLLLACKRVRFTLQKESFYTAKGLHLEGKRTTFEKEKDFATSRGNNRYLAREQKKSPKPNGFGRKLYSLY